MKLIFSTLILGLLASQSSAEQQVTSSMFQPQGPERQLADQYGGVVVGQTVTVAGNEFYQSFISLWRDKPLSERYAISVHERPSARNGNLIWVEYRRQKVYQAILPNSRSRLQAASMQAVEAVYENVVNADVQGALFREQDLAPDEI